MTKRLIDLDGALSTATLGAQIDGDGATALSAGWYIVVSVLATGSGLPNGAIAGYPFFSDDGGFAPEIGESVIPATFTRLCDIQNVSIEFSDDELEQTTLCDDIKVYRAGRTDASGSFDGITTLGITDQDGGFLNKFITKVTQSADLANVNISDIDNSTLYMQIEANKESKNGEDLAFFFFPATVISTSNGISQGSNQTFSGTYRITSDDVVKPVFFELAQPIV